MVKKIGILLAAGMILGCQPQQKSETVTENEEKGGEIRLAFNEDSVGNLNPHEYLPSQFIT